MDIDTLTHHYAVFPTIVQSNFFPRCRELNSSMLMELDRLGSIIPNSLAPRVTVPHYTTIDSCNDLHMRPVFDALTVFIKKELTVFANKQSISISKNGIKMDKMWFNVYKKGECIDIHNHPNSNFTGVYFVKASKGSSPIIIKSEIIDNMIALLLMKYLLTLHMVSFPSTLQNLEQAILCQKQPLHLLPPHQYS